MDPIPPTLATSHHSITQLTFNVHLGKLMPVSPYLSSIRASSAEKVHVCFPSAQLRKEAVGWVEEAEELGARSFGAFIRTGGSGWVELAASLRLGWTAWSHGFLSRDSTEGLYLPCTCPGGNSPDSFSQKPSIRGLIHWGGRSAQHPGGDGGESYRFSTSHAYKWWNFYLFIFQGYLFLSDTAETRNPHTALNSGSMRNNTT